MKEWEIHGPVRTLQREFAEWNADLGEWQPPRGLTIVTFRPDGQLSETEYHNPDGSIVRRARAYNDGGRVLEEQSWTNGVLTNRLLHLYDEAGRPASAIEIGADGTQRQAETCRYDDVGRKTKVVFCPPTACAVHYAIEGSTSDVAYSAPGAISQTITYDDRELPLEASFHDADHALIRRVVCSRDRDGRLLSEVMHLGEAERAQLTELRAAAFGDHPFFMATHAYDEKGRLTERVRRMGQMSEERATFRYDDHDNPVEEVSEERRRDMRIDDGVAKIEHEESHVQHTRFEYQYDGQGNWTERIALHGSGLNSDFRRSNIQRRTITYYTEGA